MKNNVIAISRQYGSGGRELANILAEKLGYKLYDRQIVHFNCFIQFAQIFLYSFH